MHYLPRCKGNPISTKVYKLEGVGPVDNRPSTNKDGGPKQLWVVIAVIVVRVLVIDVVVVAVFSLLPMSHI